MLRRPTRLIVTGVLFSAALLTVAISGCRQAQTPPSQPPVEIVSVAGPLQPINPGGPIVEITLKNVGAEPIVSLTATLALSRSFDYNFDVTPSNPLLPGKTISARLTMIGGGFSDNLSYLLTVNGAFRDAYTEPVRIAAPAQ